MDRLWRYVAHHMLWNFVLGYICLLWVCVQESTALVIPVVMIAVGRSPPFYGFLRFIVPLWYLLYALRCIHSCSEGKNH